MSFFGRSIGRFVPRNPSFITLNQPPFLPSSIHLQRRNNFQLSSINHVAIAVPDIEKSVKFYKEVLKAECSEIEPQPDHGVSTVFVNVGGASKIELITPLGDSSPIDAFLSKNKSGGLHHICIDVDDIEEAVKSLRANNVRTLTETTKIGAHGKPVIFLHPKDCNGVLLELQQK